ncbi:GNAT family N-acetyltransferase [Candidatus Woesearchaeota archaeon]|nr:GNAT family N-acetyltransferase [Candidatus Woesearchaeota archaeon]
MANNHDGLLVRILKKDEYGMWDDFVEDSEQNSVFSKSFWADNICIHTKNKFHIYGVFNKNNELVAGLPIYSRRKGMFVIAIYPPITPFMGVVYARRKTDNFSKIESYQKEVVSALNERVKKDFGYITLALHPSVIDVRPFKWENWTIDMAYTYYVNLSDMGLLWKQLDKSTKYDIKKAEKNDLVFFESDEIKDFYQIYSGTYSRQKMTAPVSENFIYGLYKTLKPKNLCKLYFVKKGSELIASSLVVFDSNMAYYLLAASNHEFKQYKASSLLLWKILEDVSSKYKEIDLVGANTPKIISFKRGYVSKLVPYYVISKTSSSFMKFLIGFYKLASKK